MAKLTIFPSPEITLIFYLGGSLAQDFKRFPIKFLAYSGTTLSHVRGMFAVWTEMVGMLLILVWFEDKTGRFKSEQKTINTITHY
jgi:hypothetical protein